MPTNLYLVRHAHSTYTPDELGRPLSDRGFADALTVTKLLSAEKIDTVYSSPYKRAMQTVEGIAEYSGKEIKIENAFRERILSEKPVEDFKAAITRVWGDFDFHWQGGESNRFSQNRGVKAVMQLLDKHVGENIVIGTHGNLMVLMMNYFDDKYGFDFWKDLGMPDIYRLSFDGKKFIDVKWIWGSV
ncbi:histidine phosphatase family protein [Lentibacillus sp. Marseille-P4043]|uniref:histidine phosphatase family protein n=1 Tax=Lentibacillus sp. Marseille-P4043 TaxID=2040293 RepID=UPI000D0AF97D|nr:histidine phosphatase family protein [Lentibacillus sp. Marseille-P4043]